jgi:hypothetical protein
MWSPVQQLTILGYFIDTEKHLIYIPEERLLKVFKTINLIAAFVNYTDYILIVCKPFYSLIVQEFVHRKKNVFYCRKVFIS